MYKNRTDVFGILEPAIAGLQRRTGLGEFLRLLAAAKPALTDALAESLGGPIQGRAVALKVLNLCLARYHYEARSTAVFSKPLGLVVDPINNCNLSCPGCVHSTRARSEKLFQWNSGMLGADCYAGLLRRYGPTALEIMLCNYGEPLLNPNTPQFIALAKSYFMRTGLSTNMTARRFDAGSYVDSGLDFMTISIDGATQATYERYRRDGDLDLAFANIRSLVLARNERGRGNPIISWQFLAFEHNADEIESAITIARDLGVDQFVVAIPFDVSWDDPTIRPAVSVEPRTVSFRGNTESRMIANFLPNTDNLVSESISAAWKNGFPQMVAFEPASDSEHTCQWLYRNMVMDATGRVLPCCAAPKPGVDLVFDQFEPLAGADSYNSGKYRDARLWFADASKYREKVRLQSPHCVQCEWNQDVAHTDSEQTDQYWRTLPGNAIKENVRRRLYWK